MQRGRWDPEAYAAQNEQFVSGINGNVVRWGYQGQRTVDLTTDITRDDVRWFAGLARRLRREQLRDGFLASGATAEEAERFTDALLDRIERLWALCEEAGKM